LHKPIGEKTVHIEEIHSHREHFMDLLLLADPSREMIMKYLNHGWLFVLYEQDEVYGVIHLDPQEDDIVEIKNISVNEEVQGRGYGRHLINHAITFSRDNGYKKIIVGTGNSSNFVFYQKMGFRFHSVKRDFFTENYAEPIFENGIHCRDMVMLDLEL
jgi:ribosomal protein S18 acetylase RimI-like enzyme